MGVLFDKILGRLRSGDDVPSEVAASIKVVGTITGEPGTNASVTNEGTSAEAKLRFVIPRGADGEQDKWVLIE